MKHSRKCPDLFLGFIFLFGFIVLLALCTTNTSPPQVVPPPAPIVVEKPVEVTNVVVVTKTDAEQLKALETKYDELQQQHAELLKIDQNLKDMVVIQNAALKQKSDDLQKQNDLMERAAEELDHNNDELMKISFALESREDQLGELSRAYELLRKLYDELIIKDHVLEDIDKQAVKQKDTDQGGPGNRGYILWNKVWRTIN